MYIYIYIYIYIERERERERKRERERERERDARRGQVAHWPEAPQDEVRQLRVGPLDRLDPLRGLAPPSTREHGLVSCPNGFHRRLVITSALCQRCGILAKLIIMILNSVCRLTVLCTDITTTWIHCRSQPLERCVNNESFERNLALIGKTARKPASQQPVRLLFPMFGCFDRPHCSFTLLYRALQLRARPLV